MSITQCWSQHENLGQRADLSCDCILDCFDVFEAVAVRDLQIRDATDEEIFIAARDADAIVLTKDSDFVDMVNARGAPPKIIWLTCGNTSNARLREIFSKTLRQALTILASDEKVVEIKDL